MKKVIIWTFFIMYAFYAVDTLELDDSFETVTDELTTFSEGIEHSYAVAATAQSVNMMYWDKMPISYSFEGCDSNEKNKIERGLKYISDDSDNLIYFKHVSYANNGIHYRCHNAPHPSGYAGTGGPSSYEGGNKILDGEVDLYPLPILTGGWYYESCGYPDVEVHETLHAFGFDHVPRGIMAQSDECTKIEKELSNCLKYIYSAGTIGGNCDDYRKL